MSESPFNDVASVAMLAESVRQRLDVLQALAHSSESIGQVAVLLYGVAVAVDAGKMGDDMKAAVADGLLDSACADVIELDRLLRPLVEYAMRRMEDAPRSDPAGATAADPPVQSLQPPS